MRIGIDTGGTYTDAVLYDDAAGVVAKAKARTRTDLSLGISEALDNIGLDEATRQSVSLVSLSTTLATNALVEGVGGRVALVFIGFTEAELDRAGLRDGLGDAPVIMADGGHDSFGVEAAPLDTEALLQAATGLEVDAFAVAGQFSVRNPAHELEAKRVLTALGKPVACGHELSAKLNGPKRALTCLLNAKLIGLIAELCQAAEQILADRGIDAPLMIVRGDGSLVSAAFAKNRPIETILSGPAASLAGAGHLTGQDTVVVSDIGGTTTDVGVLTDGRATVTVEGATVGGHRTMVEAVEMFTSGIGGDSEVSLNARAPSATLTIGPRRVTPLSLLAVEEPDLVHRTLDSRGFPYRPHDTMFVTATGRSGHCHQREQRILDALGEGWSSIDRVATTNLETSALRTLVSRGLVALAGFTPTDACHVLGLHRQGDETAAEKAAELMATAADSTGKPIRTDGKAFSKWVVDTVVSNSAEAVLGATLTVDGFASSTVRSELVSRSLAGHRGATQIKIGPATAIVGLGASAATYYPRVAELLGVESVVPHHAEVANAIGAAIGMVRISRQATIAQPSKGQFRVHLPDAGADLGDLEPAVNRTVDLLSAQVRREGAEAGADELTLEIDFEQKTAVIGGKTIFVEGTVTVTGSGRPRTKGSGS